MKDRHMTTFSDTALDEQISPHEANVVLNFFRPGAGYPAGGFQADLIALLCKADLGNAARLGQGFPGLARAVHLARNTDGGIERLRAIGALS